MSRSKITIFNMAIARSGQDKTVVEGDQAPEFTVLERNYDEIVGEAFETANFHFGKATVDLTNREDSEFDFDDRYLLPSNILHIQKVRIDGKETTLDWERIGNYIHIDYAEGITLDYFKKGAEAQWSHSFTNAIVEQLTGILRKAINEEYEEGENDFKNGFYGVQIADSRANREHKARRPFRMSKTMRSRRYGRQRFYTRGTP